MSKSSIITILICMLVVLGAGVFIFLHNDTNLEDNSNTKGYKENPSITGQPIIGNKNSPITVIEFGDFKCPGCKKWGKTILPQLKEEYLEGGKVKFAYVNAPFHGDESTVASLAAEYVYKYFPQQYWPFHEAIYTSQDKNITLKEIVKIADNFDEIDSDALEKAVKEEETSPQLNKDIELVNKFEIDQTPTVFVNNKEVTDPFDFTSLNNIIEQEIEKLSNQSK